MKWTVLPKNLVITVDQQDKLLEIEIDAFSVIFIFGQQNKDALVIIIGDISKCVQTLANKLGNFNLILIVSQVKLKLVRENLP